MAANQISAQARGVVVILEGNAWIVDADGSRKLLHIGDEVQEGQQILTEEGARLELALPNGLPLVVASGRELLIDANLLGTASQDKTEAALKDLNSGSSAIAKVIAAGGDLSTELEAPAAGLGGGDASDSHSFVRLLRIEEELNPLTLNRDADQFSNEQIDFGDQKAIASPTATPSTSSGNEDTNIAVALAGTDPDGSVVSVTVTALPPVAQGVLYLADGTTPVVAGTAITPAQAGALVFTPAANFNGDVTVSFTVTDNEGNTSAAANEVITVVNVNDAPVTDLNGGGTGGTANTAAFTEQTAVLIAPAATITDVDSANLASMTVTLTARPDSDAVESLSLNAAATAAAAGLTVTYTAATGILLISGSASKATYQTILQGVQYNDSSDTPSTTARTVNVVVNDGALNSVVNTVTINITAVNDAPTGTSKTVNINEDGIYTFSAADFGFVDGDSADSLQSVRIDTLPGAGTLRLNNTSVADDQIITLADIGNLTFTPVHDASGSSYTDLTFSVRDQSGQFAATPSAFTFNVVPVADAPIVTIALGTATTTTTTITAANVTTVGQGFTVSAFNLNGSPGTISNNGTPSGFGVVGLASGGTNEIGELNGASERLRVDFDSPVASLTVRFAWLHSGERATYTLYDSAGTQIGTGTVAGITDAVDPTLTLTSSVGAAISRIDFTATTTNIGTGDDYLINSIEFVSDKSYPLTITATPADIDYSESIASITVTVPAGATLSAGTNNGNGTWTLPLPPSGSYSVVVDSTNHGVTITGLTMTVPGNPIGAQVTVTAVAEDGADTESAATTITIGDMVAPQTTDVTVVGNEDTFVPITLNATDAASSIANFTITSLPTNGTLSYNDQVVLIGQVIPAVGNQASLIFSPNTDWNGNTSFQYRASDVAANMDQTPATVSIQINPVNDAPVNQFPAGGYTTNEDTALTLSGLVVSDVDVAAGAITVTLAVSSGTLSAANASGVTVSGSGTGSIVLSGTLANINAYLAASSSQPTYQPVADASGNVTLTMTSNDGGNTGSGGAKSDVDAITITINPVADAAPGSDAAVLIGTAVTNSMDFGTSTITGLNGASSFTFANGIVMSTSAGIFHYSTGNNLGVNANDSTGTDRQRIGDNEAVTFNFPYGMQYMALRLKNAANDSVLVRSNLEVGDLSSGSGSITGTVTTTATAVSVSASTLKVELVLEVNGNSANPITLTGTVTGGNWTVSYSGISGTITKATVVSHIDGSLFNQGGNTSAGITYAISSDMQSLSIGQDASNPFNGNNDGFQIEYIGVEANQNGTSSFSYPIDVWGLIQDSVGTAETFSGLKISDLPAGSIISVVLADGSYQEVTPNAQGEFDLSAYTDLLATATSSGADKIHLVTASALSSGFTPTMTLEINDGGNTAVTILGGSANSTHTGGAGNDYISGGAGNDTLNGGAGSDILTGGTDSDVFKWSLGDQGVAGTPAIDQITDFNVATTAAGGDVLDLQDLLQSEDGTNNLQNYLEFDKTSTPGSTVLHISSSGNFTGGTFVAGAEDQRIVFQGIADLGNSLGLGTSATDAQIIQDLLTKGKLITD